MALIVKCIMCFYPEYTLLILGIILYVRRVLRYFFSGLAAKIFDARRDLGGKASAPRASSFLLYVQHFLPMSIFRRRIIWTGHSLDGDIVWS